MILKSFIVSRDDTLPKEATIAQAVSKMNSNGLHYIILMQSNKPVAIVTERDILHALNGGSLHVNSEALQIGTKSLIKANGNRSIDYALGLMIDHKLRRIVVTDGDGNYLGVAEQEAIIYHFESEAFRTKMKLNEFLHTASKAYTIDQNASVEDAISIMNMNEIGSVLVCENGKPVTILTETDILRHSCEEDLKKRPCKDLTQKPLVFFDLSQTVENVLDQMRKHEIRRIAMYDKQNDTYFVMTTRDILRNLQGSYSLFLEKKLYASRLLFDQMEEMMVEVLDLEDSCVVSWANGAARSTLGLSVDDEICDYLPAQLWKATLRAFRNGRVHVEENVTLGLKMYRYSASETCVLGTRVIKLLFSDISTIHQPNIVLNH